MRRVLLQPSSQGVARQHYDATIGSVVRRELVDESLSPSDRELLRTRYGPRGYRVWGLVQDQRGPKRDWTDLQVGDVAVFTREGFFISSAVVVHRTHNPTLARKLWGIDDEGRTWEDMYFVDALREQQIPYERMNTILGYDKKYPFFRAYLLDEDRSANVFAAFPSIVPD